MICGVQKRLDVKVIGSKDDLEEHLLIYSDELLVPFADISSTLAGVVAVRVGIGCGERIAAVVLAVLQNLISKGLNIGGTSHRKKKIYTFFRTLAETLGKGIACSDSPTSNQGVLKGLNGHYKGSHQPSSMFLIRTLRSATSLSTVNFSLSEVVRRTMIGGSKSCVGPG